MIVICICLIILLVVFVIHSINASQPNRGQFRFYKRKLLPKTDIIRKAVHLKNPDKIIQDWIDDVDFPDPVINMDFKSYYKNTPCLCEVDQELKEKHDAQVAPIKKFVLLLNKLIILRVYAKNSSVSDKIDHTILKELNTWAKVGAMTKNVSSQGQLDRMNSLINISFIFIRLEDDWDDIPSNMDEIKTIRSWIINMTSDAKQFYKTRSNNIRAWSVLMEVVSSYIQNDKTWLDDAAKAINMLTDNINSDTGIIASELERGTKALQYHAYYADPLVCAMYVLKTIDETNSLIQSKHISKVSRLVRFIMSNPETLGNPPVKQIPIPGKMPWLYLFNQFGYKQSFSDAEMENYKKYMQLVDDYDLISDGKGSLKVLFS